MADKKAKWPANVSGKFYVDDQCIACDACVMSAPDFFEMDDKDGHAYVKKQPITDSEIEECNDAMESCPIEAIGNDG